MAQRRMHVLEPSGSIRSVRPAGRELNTGAPRRPLGIAWGRLLLVLSLAIALWALLAEAASLLLG